MNITFICSRCGAALKEVDDELACLKCCIRMSDVWNTTAEENTPTWYLKAEREKRIKPLIVVNRDPLPDTDSKCDEEIKKRTDWVNEQVRKMLELDA